MRLLTGRSFLRLSIALVNTRITGLKSLTNILESKNGRCDGSSQMPKLNGSLRFTGRSRICFELDVIYSKQPTIDYFVIERSGIGER